MKVLVIAPHPDDEVLGVGGTIAKFVDEGSEVSVCIATKASPPLYTDEAFKYMKIEILKAHTILGVKETEYLEFPAAMLESVPRYEMNQKFVSLFQKLKPDRLFIPHFGDMQKDHALISEAVMVAIRPKYDYHIKEVYSYETLSETEWNIPHVNNVFLPNTFSDISKYLSIKLEAMKAYKSQLSDFPNPRSLEAITSLAKLRGSTINVNAAEAFSLIRKIF